MVTKQDFISAFQARFGVNLAEPAKPVIHIEIPHCGDCPFYADEYCALHVEKVEGVYVLKGAGYVKNEWAKDELSARCPLKGVEAVRISLGVEAYFMKEDIQDAHELGDFGGEENNHG